MSTTQHTIHPTANRTFLRFACALLLILFGSLFTDTDTPTPPSRHKQPTATPAAATARAKKRKAKTAAFFKRYRGIKRGGTRKQMGAYTITNAIGDTIRPAVKYRLTRNRTLEIHLWVAYVTHSSVSAKPKTVSKNASLAQLYRSGVRSFWSISINNASYSYRTKVIFHNGGAAQIKRAATNEHAQQYLIVYVGGVCPVYQPSTCPEGRAGNRWYHAHPSGPIGWYGSPSSVYLPTNRHLRVNKAKSRRGSFSNREVRAACAHETAHILGLADAYPVRNAKRVVDRMNENAQTCKRIRGVWSNLMKNHNAVSKVLHNDLKMALQAYSTQVTKPNASYMQYYKTHRWYYAPGQWSKNKVSPAITNHSDKQHD